MGGGEAKQPGNIFSLFFYEGLVIGDLVVDMEDYEVKILISSMHYF